MKNTAKDIDNKFGTDGFGDMNSFPGAFILENASGECVRHFNWESETIYVVYRKDNRRVESVSDIKELEDQGIAYELIAKTSPHKVAAKALSLGTLGQIRYSETHIKISPSFDLNDEQKMGPAKMWGWSLGIQAGLLGLFFIAGLASGTHEVNKPQEVTIIPEQVVNQMLKEEKLPEAQKITTAEKEKIPVQPKTAAVAAKVEVSQTKLSKKTIVVKSNAKPRPGHKVSMRGGGGWKNEGKHGYGTNEKNMNEIGALNALDNSPRVKGGNGGRGGLNLQAVSNEAGSGAGGKGQGGFGSNGAGGRGLGGLGKGKGMGLSNAMYGKGLVAAPFGDGGAAPGSGGYGTRGKMGGGAQGAGYGNQTIVGSWKGTGPHGDGPAGSGWGKGGEGWGAGLDDGDAVGAVVSGGLDMDQVQQVIDRHKGEITYCYEKGLQTTPNLKGRVTMRFEIGARGQVNWAKVNRTTVRSAAVESCITSHLKTWGFPKPQGGVTVGVTYPFNLGRNMASN
jgi:hypothetical protein